MACKWKFSSDEHWCEGHDIVYRDEQGDEYCVFHAPKDKKRKALGSEECYKVEEFNDLVFAEIDRASKDTGNCNLSGTIFPGDIFFQRYDKKRPLPWINFFKATFFGKAHFAGTAFDEAAVFSFAKFKAEAFFGLASFNNDANFDYVEFGGKALFDGVKIGGNAYFDEAKFNAGADFRRAQFHGGASFAKVTFKGRADFFGALFIGGAGADFSGAEFGAVADFETVKFQGTAKFKWARFRDEAYFKEDTFISSADLSSVLLHEAKYLRLEFVDLRKVTFLDTDVRKIEFVGCDYPKNKDGEDVLYDESALDPTKNANEYKTRLGKVELLYRRLKQRSKEEHNEPMVSNWHTREKEMQRRATGGDKCFQKVFINAYRFSSGYGENPKRAAWWLAIIVVLAVVLTGNLGIKKMVTCESSEKPLTFYTAGRDAEGCVFLSEEFWRIPVYTLEDLSFQRGVAYEPANTWGRFFRLLFRLFAILQFTLFALALRNRFRR